LLSVIHIAPFDEIKHTIVKNQSIFANLNFFFVRNITGWKRFLDLLELYLNSSVDVVINYPLDMILFPTKIKSFVFVCLLFCWQLRSTSALISPICSNLVTVEEMKVQVLLYEYEVLV